jgi:predicted GIY-YIG superfamily endonuclease
LKPKKRGTWTYEMCKDLASGFENRMEFHKRYKVAYVTASKNGWLKEICEHMGYNQTSPGTWTYEKCKNEASKYESRSEFQKRNYNVYRRAYDNGWLNEICKHMKPKGNIYKRMVYVYIFDDNFFYVGLTCNKERRMEEHVKTNTSVYKHISKTNSGFKYVELTKYIDVEESIKKEKYFLDKFIKEGMIALNRNKTGGLGGGRKKWNYDTCKAAASLCVGRYEFSRKYGRAYTESKINGWLCEFFPVLLTHISRIERTSIKQSKND